MLFDVIIVSMIMVYAFVGLCSDSLMLFDVIIVSRFVVYVFVGMLE